MPTAGSLKAWCTMLEESRISWTSPYGVWILMEALSWLYDILACKTIGISTSSARPCRNGISPKSSNNLIASGVIHSSVRAGFPWRNSTPSNLPWWCRDFTIVLVFVRFRLEVLGLFRGVLGVCGVCDSGLCDVCVGECGTEEGFRFF